MIYAHMKAPRAYMNAPRAYNINDERRILLSNLEILRTEIAHLRVNLMSALEREPGMSYLVDSVQHLDSMFDFAMAQVRMDIQQEDTRRGNS